MRVYSLCDQDTEQTDKMLQKVQHSAVSAVTAQCWLSKSKSAVTKTANSVSDIC